MAALVRLLGLWWLLGAHQADGYRSEEYRLEEEEEPQQTGERRLKDALLEQLRRSGVEDKVGQRLQEAVASVKEQSGKDEDVRWLDREEEEKIGFWIMTDLEHQRWVHRGRKRHYYNLAEAQHVLRRHFESAHNNTNHTRETAMASLLQLEEQAGSKEQAAFWRRHRWNLGIKSNVFKPAVAAYACVQVDINLAFIYLPFLYVNLGIMGQLSYDFVSHCWGWTLEVSIALSGGVPLGWGLKLGLGVSLSGNWALQEVPFMDTGLKASDYTLPQQCSVEAHPQLTPTGMQHCHTSNPFKLVWSGLHGILGKVARSIFPFQRVTKLVDRELQKAQVEENKKTYLRAQAERWDSYKAILQRPEQGSSADAIGTDAVVVTCESVRFLWNVPVTAVFLPGKIGMTTKKDGKVMRVKADSQAEHLGVVYGWYVLKVDGEDFTPALLKQKEAQSSGSFEVTFQKHAKSNPLMTPNFGPRKRFSCGFSVGMFASYTDSVSDGSILKFWNFDNYRIKTTIGAQVHESKSIEAPHDPENTGYHEVHWSVRDEPNANMLVDAGSNRQIKVVVKAEERHPYRVEGVAELDPAIFTGELPTTVQVPVGCAAGPIEGSPGNSIRGCAGKVSLKLQRAEPRGTLSLQCLSATLKASSKGSYCAVSLSRSAVMGRNPVWRSTRAPPGAGPWWGEGTSFGIYAAAGHEHFPVEGHKSVAATVSIFEMGEEHGVDEEIRAVHVDTFNQGLDPIKASSTDVELGSSTLTWSDLLGDMGFESRQDTEARAIIKHLGGKGTVYLRVGWRYAWKPFEPLRGENWELVKTKDFDVTRLAKAGSGFFTAGEQFIAKLPKYAEQVLERLLDDPQTDEIVNGKLSVDCAKNKTGFFGYVKSCALLDTDGQAGARMHRQVDPNSTEGSTVYRKGEETEWVLDDRVMNLAKAARVSRNRDEPEFWRELSISAANLFTRSVADIQALFLIYFADDATWDGDCSVLKPSFELPFEMADGAERGRMPDRRYQPSAEHRLKDTRHIGLERGAKLAQSRKSTFIDGVDETFNPFLDHTFAYGHGYNPHDAEATSKASLRFLSPDPPQRGRLGGMHFEGYTSPTVYPHLWCELSKRQLQKTLLNLVAPNKTEEGVIALRSHRLEGRLSYTLLFRERSRRFRHVRKFGPAFRGGYESKLSESLAMWDKDSNGNLDPEELTVAIDEACVDSEDCGDRATCEKVRLKPTFITLFPSLARNIRRFMKLFSDRLERTRQAAEKKSGKKARPKRLRMEEARAGALEAIQLVRFWLEQVGACSGDGHAQAASIFARGENPLKRETLCRAADSKTGMVFYKGELARAARHAADRMEKEWLDMCLNEVNCDPNTNLVEDMTLDFHQAFAIDTRLPMSLQHTAMARQHFELIGAVWSGLPSVQRKLEPRMQEKDEERAILEKLESHARARMNELAARINPQDAHRIKFPLTRTTFTLSLTAETATPGFCTPNEALLFLSWAVSGQTMSWSNDPLETVRCFGAKVHPHNFFLQVTRCRAIKGEASLSGIFAPQKKNKDTDTQVTMLTELFDFTVDGGWDSVFKSIDPANKILSSNFLNPVNEAAAAAVKQHLGGAAFWGLLASPFVWVILSTDTRFLSNVAEMLQEGVYGAVKGLQTLFRKVRQKAEEDPKGPGSQALANESSGEDFVNNVDPNRQQGKAFAISGEEDDGSQDEVDDWRLFKADPLCNSFCGGKSYWTGEGLAGTAVITGFSLRADQCARCAWQQPTCGAMQITERKSLLMGYLCCVVRRCTEAEMIPPDDLPLCPARNSEVAKAEPCCNTQCGAPGAGVGDYKVVPFSDAYFLQPGDCAQCVWSSSACPSPWAQEFHSLSRLCCLRHHCVPAKGDLTKMWEAEEREVRVLRYQRHPKCGNHGVARPGWSGGSASQRTGGTDCGAMSFGSTDYQYSFSDPLFLMKDGKPNYCGQCIWVEHRESCRKTSLELEDGTTVTGLSKLHSSVLSFWHLCCTKVECTRIYEEEEDYALLESARPQPPRVELGRRPGMLAQVGAATQAKGINLMWIMQVTGTLHHRHYGADSVPTTADDLTNFSRRWWTWEIHVEGWNWLHQKFTFGGMVDATPVVALNLDWDLTEAFSSKINGILKGRHDLRLKKCVKCIRNQQGYCSRKYVDGSYDHAIHEVCHSLEPKSARLCNQVVGYDDFGKPTSARFIVSEAECYTMRWRKFNAGYHRHYGPTTKFRDFRGYTVMPKAPLDRWGNSQEQFEEDGEEGDEGNEQDL